MFLSTLTERGPNPALVKTLAFHEARLRTIAENIANLATPQYRAKQLDAKAFQEALQKSLVARGNDLSKPLMVKSGREIRTDASGRLQVTPSVRPVDNVLFHDGTNLSIERELSDLAETGLAYEQATQLLKKSYDGIRSAIRGTAS